MSDSYTILNKVNDPKDIRNLSIEELETLCAELRDYLVKTVSQTSGHLASGLGVVELTVALHYVYNTPYDQLVWDVGHQAYPHKILTGRREELAQIRKRGGLHPFCWKDESPYDVFSTGHASTSLGEALGLSIANRVLKNDKKVVAVIGDGAFTGGAAFEALNHAGDLHENMLIVLNDNEMSISESVGFLAKHFAMWLSSPKYAKFLDNGKKVLENVPKLREFALKAHEHIKGMVIPGTIFEEFGFNYVGPIDGHDLKTLIPILKNLRTLDGPQVLHIATRKGKGYEPAEKEPTKYHGVPKFDTQTGIKASVNKTDYSYSDLFGKWLIYQAKKDEKIIGITPAMCEGSGMSEFAKQFPKQYMDVAIAEQHALILASGLAVGGLKPVVSMYSTFLQRGYDQLFHDLSVQNAPVIVGIDRAGVVGPDGPTHQGVFDIGFLKALPNFTICTPSDAHEMWTMFNTALTLNSPVAIRYPKMIAKGGDKLVENDELIEIGKAQILRNGNHICVLAWGPLAQEINAYATEHNIDVTIVNMRFVKPYDKDLVLDMAKKHQTIITVEDGAILSGIGETVSAQIASNAELTTKVINLGIRDELVEQGSISEIYQENNLDTESIFNLITQLTNNNK